MRKKYTLLLTLLMFFINVCQGSAQPDTTYKIIIVAGQSNTLNWHSAASEINTLAIDDYIPFYYHCGAPPDRGFDTPFNVTSNGEWTTLKTQTQTPYIALEKDFFGPEITLARKLYEQFGTIAVFKCAFFGTNLAKDWDPNATNGNQLYQIFLEQLHNALPKDSLGNWKHTIDGVFWMQGESDASKEPFANAYENNLRSFVQTLRTDLQNPELTFTIARIGAQLPAPYIYKNTVRKAQVNVAEEDPLADWVDTDDLPLDTDNVHHIAHGTKLLGIRWAESFLGLTTHIHYEHQTQKTTGITINHNPWKTETLITCDILPNEQAYLKVYDIRGSQVYTATMESTNGLITHRMQKGQLASGVYILSIETSLNHYTKKMLIIK